MDELLMVSNPYWQVNTVLMKIMGLWPVQKNYVKIPIRITVLVFINLLLVPQVVRGIEEWGKNTLIVVETIAGFFVTISPIVKYIFTFVAESKLQYLYQQIMQDWRTLNEDGEQRILCEVGEVGRILTIGYSGYLYITTLLFAVAPGVIPAISDYLMPQNVSRPKALCIFGEFFIDQQTYYYQLLFITCLSALITVSVYTTVDTTYTCCVQHIVGLFNIVE